MVLMSKSKLTAWLISRLVFCLVFSSIIQMVKFAPFLSQPDINILDPWSSWVNSDGRVEAFPYGIVMFLFFIPGLLVHELLQFLSIEVDFSILITSTLVVIEFVMFKLLRVFDDDSRRIWSWMMISSPLPIYISYIHGQVDIIPSLIMLISVLFLIKNKWLYAGLSFGLVVAAKFSFAVALPFFLFYFLSKKIRWENGFNFLKGTLPGLLMLAVPFFYSDGYRTMVLETPEVLRSLDAQIDLGVSTIYLVPIVFLLVFFSFWNLNQVSTLTLISYIGTAYFAIALTQTSSIGWFYWGFPLIFFGLKDASLRTLGLFTFWQSGICIYFALIQGDVSLRFFKQFELIGTKELQITSLIFTFNILLGTLLALKILSEALKNGDIYSLADRPFSLSIAGDSGVGKDTLSVEIAKLFGEQDVALLLGDDYHLHERGDTSWLTTTHLSVEANDLEGMGRDFKRLLNREGIFVKHYDHTVGRFTLPRKIKSSQLIIVNGLHASLIPGHQHIDLRVFLTMDEDLRIELKINRDKTERRQFSESVLRESIAARKPHFERYVKPQMQDSDLKFHLSSISGQPSRVGLSVTSKDSAFIIDFKNLFDAISQTTATLVRRDGEIELNIDPNCFKGSDADIIFQKSVRSSDQLFPAPPKFGDGSKGVMSLITVLALIRKRTNYV